MKVNIYYGGRGVLEDPTSYVLSRMEKALAELRVEVHRYNIYEYKNEIYTLPETFKDADGVILATTVEWLGIGGYMSQFLDACYLYGDRSRIKDIYMQPVVMSTTYGEKDGLVTLDKAWEILGGRLCDGLSGYVEDLAKFQMSPEYGRIIEKKAENLFRTISQQTKSLPTSSRAVTESVLQPQPMELTPQESEQMGHYAADDAYVKRQKEDVEELSSIFRDLIGAAPAEDASNEYILDFESHFHPQENFKGRYSLLIEGKKKPLFIEVNGEELEVHYGQEENVDLFVKIPKEAMTKLISGHMTFQRAFSVGEITSRGDFGNLRKLDELFPFEA